MESIWVGSPQEVWSISLHKAEYFRPKIQIFEKKYWPKIKGPFFTDIFTNHGQNGMIWQKKNESKTRNNIIYSQIDWNSGPEWARPGRRLSISAHLFPMVKYLKESADGPSWPKWERANEGPLGPLACFLDLFLALWLKLAIFFMAYCYVCESEGKRKCLIGWEGILDWNETQTGLF